MRIRYGELGPQTTWADLGREMEIHRDRPWAWETKGRFPGREVLAALLGRLGRIRKEGVDPLALAAWVELGPDDSPPWGPEPDSSSSDLVHPTPSSGVREEDVQGFVRELERAAAAGGLRDETLMRIYVLAKDYLRARGLTVKAADSYPARIALKQMSHYSRVNPWATPAAAA